VSSVDGIDTHTVRLHLLKNGDIWLHQWLPQDAWFGQEQIIRIRNNFLKTGVEN
jgi:hypothetical protein